MTGSVLTLPGLTVHCLRDGTYEFPAKVFPDVSDHMRENRLAAAGLDHIATEFSAYLLRFESGETLLVDAGCGALYGDAAGELAGRLEDLDIAPSDIDTLVLTHLHGDHCGGAIQEGRAVFPNAKVLMHKDEFAHWQGSTGPASEVLGAYAGKITLIEEGGQIAADIVAWHLPGHTPGHMGLKLGPKHVLVGDILHSFALQLPDPSVNSIYDLDADTAQTTRIAALSQIADQDLVWSGSHGIGADRFGRLVRTSQGFAQVAL